MKEILHRFLESVKSFAKHVQKNGLTGSQLKLVALVTMTIDHIGVILLPQVTFLRVVGRLAYPIYAYMIAEGCAHTKDIQKYLTSIVSLAAVCQLVYFLALGSVYQGILVTFSISIGLIMLLKKTEKVKTTGMRVIAAVAVFAALFVTEILPLLLPGTDFGVDYGFLGVLLPVCVYFAGSGMKRFWVSAGLLALMGLKMGGIQWFGLLAVPLLYLYNGKRGKGSKRFFYIYYPAHLAAISLLEILFF